METDMLRDETAPADIPGLVAQARAAYQQNRIKECLALTKAALLVDPGNMAALEMQSAVRFDMQRDLSDARALIEESRNKPEAQKYRKAAEIILLKALYLDPDSEGAKTLLSSIRTASDTPVAFSSPSASAPYAPAVPPAAVEYTAPAPPPPVVVAAPPVPPLPPPPKPEPPVETPIVFAPQVAREPIRVVVDEPFDDPFVEETPVVHSQPAVASVDAKPYIYEEPSVSLPAAARIEPIASANVMQPGISVQEPIPFTVGTSYIEKPGYMKSGKKKEGRSNYAVPLTIVAIVLIAGGLFLARHKFGTNAAASTTSESSSNATERPLPKPGVYTSPSTASAPAPTVSTVGSSTPAKPPLSVANIPPAVPALPAPTPVPAVNAKTPPATAPVNGSLAVSSAVAAEIYQGDKHLGSTPTTLQLPAGNQTLEYRHADLRTVVTHVIKAKETTTALVTFDAIVQLNARPWATVSIEGSPRMALGQTPLSDVRLPVGSVLVFENPNFPSKSHKIVASDKAIQMVFP
jgi:hypothetical protein